MKADRVLRAARSRAAVRHGHREARKAALGVAYGPERPLCTELAFGRWQRKALPLEKINRAPRRLCLAVTRAEHASRPAASCASSLPALGTEALWPGQPVTRPLLCNPPRNLFMGLCHTHTHTVKGNSVLHLARQRVPEGQAASTPMPGVERRGLRACGPPPPLPHCPARRPEVSRASAGPWGFAQKPTGFGWRDGLYGCDTVTPNLFRVKRASPAASPLSTTVSTGTGGPLHTSRAQPTCS